MARILMLTPQLPIPPQALTGWSQGTTIRNYHLLAGLAKNHVVDLVALSDAAAQDASDARSGRMPEAESLASLLKPYCRTVITATKPRRTLVRRARDTLLSPLPDMALRLASPALLADLKDQVSGASRRSEPYDVIQVEGIEMAPYLLALCEAGARLVFDDHNAEYVLQQRAFLSDVRRPRRWLGAAYSFIQWRKLAAYERRVCRAADQVVAVSEPDRDALQRLLPGAQVTVIPNGVDLEFYRPGIVPPPAGLPAHALVFTGKMDYRPNVDAALWFAGDVLPLIRARLPDAHFFIVGQAPHPRLVTALEGRPGVTLTGRVPDVRPYIAGAAVYVVPLRIGGGTRLKVLEAMAMGQAIVSTRLGCDGFRLTDNREVSFADEPRAFADAVIALIGDRPRRAALGRAARAYVEQYFGWDAIVPRLEELYR